MSGNWLERDLHMSIGDTIRVGGRRSPSIAGVMVKLFFGVLGASCVMGGSLAIQAHVMPGLSSERAEATLIGRRSSCVLEYQLSNESDPRREGMPCDKAESAVAANPGRHIRLERDEFLRLRFPLSNGRMHETEIRTGFGNSLPATVGAGAEVPIYYSGAQASEVRIAMPLSSVIDYIFVTGFGLLVLLITLFGSANSRYRPSKSLAQAASI